MAIISAEEFLASREAIDADVQDVSPDHAELAISEAEAALEQELGYKVADDATTVTVYGGGEGFIYLPHRARSISSLTYGGTTIASTGYYVADEGFSLWQGARGHSVPWHSSHPVVITGTFGYAETDAQYVLAKKVVRILAARALASTDSDSEIPDNLSTLTAEGATFDFDTEDSKIQSLINQIGRHPYKKGSDLYTISLSGGMRELTPEMIFQGLETPDDL